VQNKAALPLSPMPPPPSTLSEALCLAAENAGEPTRSWLLAMAVGEQAAPAQQRADTQAATERGER
jgi:hypothetical protein